MRIIVAIIRPEKLTDVLKSLYAADVRGLTVSRVQGHGGEIETVETNRGSRIMMGLSEKVRLDIGVSEPFVEIAVDAIMKAARTGEVGDGKIFVMPVSRIFRIRTGEKDRAAVTPILPESS
jgi:nitrogen regulatory protein P-II 1